MVCPLPAGESPIDARSDSVLRLIESFVCGSIRKNAKSLIEVKDLTPTLNPTSHSFGRILDSQITASSPQSLAKLRARLDDGLEWNKGSVSALAEKGESLLIFLDQEGEPILGFYHENRWGENRYQIARISRDSTSGFRFLGTVPVNDLDPSREFPRDVPLVFEP